jgi:hypothetical protein
MLAHLSKTTVLSLSTSNSHQATTPAHVRELWQKVCELLGEEQTPLQKEALAIRVNGTTE